MPIVAQVCMVIVTVAVVGIAIMAIRLMLQTKALIENVNRSLAELPSLLADVKRTSAHANEVLVSVSQITHSAQVGATHFEDLATRSSTMAATLLDELDRPVSQAVGVIRAIRFGANFLMQRFKSRDGKRPNTNQGDDHVGEQRWVDDGGIPAGSGGGSRRGAAARTDER